MYIFVQYIIYILCVSKSKIEENYTVERERERKKKDNDEYNYQFHSFFL